MEGDHHQKFSKAEKRRGQVCKTKTFLLQSEGKPNPSHKNKITRAQPNISLVLIFHAAKQFTSLHRSYSKPLKVIYNRFPQHKSQVPA